MSYRYQMTVQEFADLVANTVYDCGYFQKGQIAHPEDIEAAFTAVATAVAKGATHVIAKINDVNVNYVINNISTSSTNIV